MKIILSVASACQNLYSMLQKGRSRHNLFTLCEAYVASKDAICTSCQNSCQGEHGYQEPKISFLEHSKIVTMKDRQASQKQNHSYGEIV